jgi:hypothetical protein
LDAELVCLAVAQVLLGCNSERRWLRFVGHRLRHLFPYVPGRSGYNRRLLDATPVPCGASRETVRRSDLAGWAGDVYDRSHPRWYWGLKLYLLAAPDGHAGGLGLASDQGLLRPGMVGHRFAQGVGQLGAVLVRPNRRDEPHR